MSARNTFCAPPNFLFELVRVYSVCRHRGTNRIDPNSFDPLNFLFEWVLVSTMFLVGQTEKTHTHTRHFWICTRIPVEIRRNQDSFLKKQHDVSTLFFFDYYPRFTGPAEVLLRSDSQKNFYYVSPQICFWFFFQLKKLFPNLWLGFLTCRT